MENQKVLMRCHFSHRKLAMTGCFNRARCSLDATERYHSASVSGSALDEGSSSEANCSA